MYLIDDTLSVQQIHKNLINEVLGTTSGYPQTKQLKDALHQYILLILSLKKLKELEMDYYQLGKYIDTLDADTLFISQTLLGQDIQDYDQLYDLAIQQFKNKFDIEFFRLEMYRSVMNQIPVYTTIKTKGTSSTDQLDDGQDIDMTFLEDVDQNIFKQQLIKQTNKKHPIEVICSQQDMLIMPIVEDVQILYTTGIQQASIQDMMFEMNKVITEGINSNKEYAHLIVDIENKQILANQEYLLGQQYNKVMNPLVTMFQNYHDVQGTYVVPPSTNLMVSRDVFDQFGYQFRNVFSGQKINIIGLLFINVPIAQDNIPKVMNDWTNTGILKQNYRYYFDGSGDDFGKILDYLLEKQKTQIQKQIMNDMQLGKTVQEIINSSMVIGYHNQYQVNEYILENMEPENESEPESESENDSESELENELEPESENENELTQILDMQTFIDSYLHDSNSGTSRIRNVQRSICQHHLDYETLTKTQFYDYNRYLFLITEFVNKYFSFDTNYFCISCTEYIHGFGKFFEDKKFGDDGNIMTFKVIIQQPLYHIRQYSGFQEFIQALDTFVNRISSSVGIRQYSGMDYGNQNNRKTVMKNTIDLCQFFYQKYRYIKKFTDIKQLQQQQYFDSQFFIFQIDDDIFKKQQIQKDFYQQIKQNNLMVLISLFMLIQLNSNEVIGLLNDTQNTNFLHFMDYAKNKQFQGRDIQGTPISQYPVLCYLIFMFSSTIMKLRIWQLDDKLTSITDTMINFINMIMQQQDEQKDNLLIKDLIQLLNTKLGSGQQYRSKEIIEQLKSKYLVKTQTGIQNSQVPHWKNAYMLLSYDDAEHYFSTTDSYINDFNYPVNFNNIRQLFTKYRPQSDTGLNTRNLCLDGNNHGWKADKCKLCNQQMSAGYAITNDEMKRINNLIQIQKIPDHDIEQFNVQYFPDHVPQKPNIQYHPKFIMIQDNDALISNWELPFIESKKQVIQKRVQYIYSHEENQKYIMKQQIQDIMQFVDDHGSDASIFSNQPDYFYILNFDHLGNRDRQVIIQDLKKSTQHQFFGQTVFYYQFNDQYTMYFSEDDLNYLGFHDGKNKRYQAIAVNRNISLEIKYSTLWKLNNIIGNKFSSDQYLGIYIENIIGQEYYDFDSRSYRLKQFFSLFLQVLLAMSNMDTKKNKYIDLYFNILSGIKVSKVDFSIWYLTDPDYIVKYIVKWVQEVYDNQSEQQKKASLIEMFELMLDDYIKIYNIDQKDTDKQIRLYEINTKVMNQVIEQVIMDDQEQMEEIERNTKEEDYGYDYGEMEYDEDMD